MAVLWDAKISFILFVSTNWHSNKHRALLCTMKTHIKLLTLAQYTLYTLSSCSSIAQYTLYTLSSCSSSQTCRWISGHIQFWPDFSILNLLKWIYNNPLPKTMFLTLWFCFLFSPSSTNQLTQHKCDWIPSVLCKNKLQKRVYDSWQCRCVCVYVRCSLWRRSGIQTSALWLEQFALIFSKTNGRFVTVW